MAWQEKLPFSPNRFGAIDKGGIWNINPTEIRRSNPTTINTPWFKKGSGVYNARTGAFDQINTQAKTTFSAPNPNKPGTVRIYRGEGLHTPKEISRYSELQRKQDVNQLKKFNQARYHMTNLRDYRGPLTGQWWTASPSAAMSRASLYKQSGTTGVFSYMDVKPSTLKKWVLNKPMPEAGFVVPQNVIKSQAKKIPVNIQVRAAPSIWQRFLKWARPNLRATAGAGMALGKNPMHSSKIKGMGNALEDPSNFYLNLNTGGIVSLVQL